MWVISSLCLVFLSIMCVIGTLSNAYDDNLLQRIGMACICFGALAKANDILGARAVNPEMLIAHIGLASFAAGTTFKVWLRRTERMVRKSTLRRRSTDWSEFNGMPIARDFTARNRK